MTVTTCVLIGENSSQTQFLSRTLKTLFPTLVIAAQLQTLQQAIPIITNHRPQYVFLVSEQDKAPSLHAFRALQEVCFQLIWVLPETHEVFPLLKTSAIPYILQPISKSSVIRVMEQLLQSQNIESVQDSHNDLHKKEEYDKIGVQADGRFLFFERNDIVVIKAEGSYTSLHLQNQKEILISKTLKEVMDNFKTNSCYYRVHKSYCINLNHIKEYRKSNNGAVIMSNGMHINVSRHKKEGLLNLLLV